VVVSEVTVPAHTAAERVFQTARLAAIQVHLLRMHRQSGTLTMNDPIAQHEHCVTQRSDTPKTIRMRRTAAERLHQQLSLCFPKLGLVTAVPGELSCSHCSSSTGADEIL
jgi:hypothetical protein